MDFYETKRIALMIGDDSGRDLETGRQLSKLELTALLSPRKIYDSKRIVKQLTNERRS
ncbi:MAG TPA: hypothetical protein VH500_19575 [Nitrososphaeraceae archaeon]